MQKSTSLIVMEPPWQLLSWHSLLPTNQPISQPARQPAPRFQTIQWLTVMIDAGTYILWYLRPHNSIANERTNERMNQQVVDDDQGTIILIITFIIIILIACWCANSGSSECGKILGWWLVKEPTTNQPFSKAFSYYCTLVSRTASQPSGCDSSLSTG